MGDYAKAEPLLKEALEIRQKVLGREHPDTATSLNNLAGALSGDGRLCESRAAVQRGAGRFYQKALGREHPDTATSLNNLAGLYEEMGDYAKAEPLFKEAWRFAKKSLAGSIPIRREA